MERVALLLFLNLFVAVASLNYANILFVIVSQSHPYHTSLADRLRKEIKTQALEEEHRMPAVEVIHSKGSWTVLPILSKLAKKYSTAAEWVFFCDDHTALRLPNLLRVLKKYDSKEEIWIGHALTDVEPTIIHHFSYSEGTKPLTYPNFGSGVAMSMALLRTLHHRFQESESISSIEFSIDPSFELAQFAWNNGEGSALTHSNHFCVISSDTCATYPKSYDACGDPVSIDSFYFAVKTYHKFHKDRVPVVKKTWGKYATNIMFFSDKNDTDIPAMELGIENTEKGHCGKTIAILNYLSTQLVNYPDVKWVVIADDDTILSVSRLCEVISCYGAKNIALGERYGYRLLGGKGYDYVTGGGGTVLSVDLLPMLAECTCPAPSSPDDMWIGICLAKLKVPVIHSPLFHQGRPMDYTLEYLAPHRPVSFHKHWMLDPIKIYKQWFAVDDEQMASRNGRRNIRHSEL